MWFKARFEGEPESRWEMDVVAGDILAAARLFVESRSYARLERPKPMFRPNFGESGPETRWDKVNKEALAGLKTGGSVVVYLHPSVEGRKNNGERISRGAGKPGEKRFRVTGPDFQTVEEAIEEKAID